MPTNDERREVAARLRDYSTRNFDESSPWLYMSKALTGSFTAYDDASDLFTDLADLIEPEPERTCELIKHAARDEESGIELVLYECGQCGWIVDPSRNERYCPSCGAKVVSG